MKYTILFLLAFSLSLPLSAWENHVEDYSYSAILYDGNNTEIYGRSDKPFNNGSLAKVITSLLVMKLQHEGFIHLDDELEKGISYRMVLNHTSGIGQRGSHTAYESKITSSEIIGPDFTLEQEAEPGAFIIYSSPAFILIERALEKRLSDSFPNIVQKWVFDPLGMRSSGYYSSPYQTRIPSAGNVVSTAEDMGLLIYALLGNREEYLPGDTLKAMYALSSTHGSSEYGRALGFIRSRYRGKTMVYHDGGAPGTNSRLVLFPEDKKAYYLVYESNSYSPKKDVHQSLLKSWFGLEEKRQTLTPQNFPQEGYYNPFGYSGKTIEKIGALMGQIKVSVQDGQLLVGGKLYELNDDGFFRREGSQTPLGFELKEGEDFLYIGNSAYQNVPFFASLPGQMIILLTLLAVLLFSIICNKGIINRILLAGAFAAVLFELISLITLDYWLLAYGIPWQIFLPPYLFLIFAIIYGLRMIFRKRVSWQFLSAMASMVGLLFWLFNWNFF